MSGSNYFYCAKCDCKSVYTAGDEEDDNVDVETGYPLPDGNVGRMVLLCRECAKKYILRIEDRAITQQLLQPDPLQQISISVE